MKRIIVTCYPCMHAHLAAVPRALSSLHLAMPGIRNQASGTSTFCTSNKAYFVRDTKLNRKLEYICQSFDGGEYDILN